MAEDFPNYRHFRVYLHLCLTSPPPLYYLLEFHRTPPPPPSQDAHDASPSTPWGRVYGLPLSTWGTVVEDFSMTDEFKDLDLRVMMHSIATLNKSMPVGVGWLLKTTSLNDGGFQVLLESTLNAHGPSEETGGETEALEGMVSYLVLVPGLESYISAGNVKPVVKPELVSGVGEEGGGFGLGQMAAATWRNCSFLLRMVRDWGRTSSRGGHHDGPSGRPTTTRMKS